MAASEATLVVTGFLNLLLLFDGGYLEHASSDGSRCGYGGENVSRNRYGCSRRIGIDGADGRLSHCLRHLYGSSPLGVLALDGSFLFLLLLLQFLHFFLVVASSFNLLVVLGFHLCRLVLLLG